MDTKQVVENISGKKIAIHLLKNFPSSILNGDENGRPKVANFGGVIRDRLSSQNIKHAIRRSEVLGTLDKLGIRTRYMPELVLERMMALRDEDESLSEAKDDVLKAAAERLQKFGKNSDKGGEESEEGKKTSSLTTAQALFYSDADIQNLAQATMEAIRDCEFDLKKVKAMKADKFNEYLVDCGASPISIDMALFGRMVTSDLLSDVESSVQVAHALSTHAAYREMDFFTCIDEMLESGKAGSGDSGAAMMDYKPFRSSCFYMYAAVDLGVLAENMAKVTNGETMIAEVVEAFIRAFAMSYSKTGQSAFAAQVLPDLVMVEVQDGNVPTYEYINAFEAPVKTYGQNPEVVKNSVKALAGFVDTMDEAYELPIRHRGYFAPRFADEIAPEKCEKFTKFNSLTAAVKEWIKE